MPTYDYACRFCDHTFEHFQGIHDPHLRKCPECGRHGLKRLFGAGAGVVFKGSGFYETDYKRKGGGGKPAPEKSSDTSGKDGGGKGSGDKTTADAGKKPSDDKSA